MAERAIVGFHRDEQGDWVAELECGHGQHVRHRPPWELRPWVMTEEGRRAHLGQMLRCLRCDKEQELSFGIAFRETLHKHLLTLYTCKENALMVRTVP